MPKTVQIRNIDDETYAALQHNAGYLRMTVPEYLRREIERLAARPTMEEWLERIKGRTNPVDPAETIKALDEIRGPWPDDSGR